ncbi:MAG TPA: hypothetical protein VLE89_05055 [Chlamydiales bacterium]|nr:hypothetical protein [Chlamydiales bacterium]
MEPKHPWKARLIICVVMLVLAFIGLLYANISANGGWDYWKWIVPVYAILALWLSWYLRRHKHSLSPVTLWHEVLHWLALVGSAYLISRFLHLGILSRFLAGLAVLTVIAQAVFIAGIYIESSFIFIGLVLGVFAWLVAMTIEYLYLYIAIPVLVLGIGLVAWHIWKGHKKSKTAKDD